MIGGINMSMLDLSDVIPIDFLFKMLFGAALFSLDFWAIPNIIREIEDSYRPLNARIGYLILTIGLVLAPFGIWYNAYVNCSFYDLFPLSFIDFWLTVCVLVIGIFIYGMIERR